MAMNCLQCPKHVISFGIFFGRDYNSEETYRLLPHPGERSVTCPKPLLPPSKTNIEAGRSPGISVMVGQTIRRHIDKQYSL